MTADEASPILGGDMNKILAALPQEPQVIALFKKIAGPEPLPAR